MPGRHEGREWLVLDTYFAFAEISTPATPPSNQIRLYAKDSSSTSTLCYKNDAGTEICFPVSGSFVTGTGANTRVAFWSGTSTLSSDAGFTFTSNRLTTPDATISNMTLGSVLFAGTSGAVSQDNSNFFWDNTNKRLGIGGVTSPVGAIQVRGAGADGQVYANRIDATAPGPGIIGMKARGSVGSETAPLANDNLVQVVGQGFQGSSYTSQAQFRANAAENWGASAKGTYLTLETTATSSTTIAERFRVGPAGQWGIGGATFGSSGDVFRSGGASAAPTWTAPSAVTAGSSKITLGGSPSTAGLSAFSIDVAEGNLTHNNLGGLTTGDPHTQYALLAGRSGGQTLIGGTASADDLTLQSTSNATRGDLITDVADITMVAASRARMSGQNRFRYLNVIGQFSMSTSSADLSNAALHAVSWDTEQIDTDGIHESVTNPTRLTVSMTGKYLVTSNTGWTANATGRRGLLLKKNGSTFIGAGQYIQACTSNETIAAASWIVSLAANDYVEIIAQQFSGGNLKLLGDDTFQNVTSVAIAYIGE